MGGVGGWGGRGTLHAQKAGLRPAVHGRASFCLLEPITGLARLHLRHVRLRRRVLLLGHRHLLGHLKAAAQKHEDVWRTTFRAAGWRHGRMEHVAKRWRRMGFGAGRGRTLCCEVSACGECQGRASGGDEAEGRPAHLGSESLGRSAARSLESCEACCARRARANPLRRGGGRSARCGVRASHGRAPSPRARFACSPGGPLRAAW